jgi:NAD(P)-dependent dehydrogenase (short-subunit alcohol dehydrogenase family)
MNENIKPALAGKHGDRLEGKVALVTGIAAGIGKGVALLFAQQGARVVGCDIDSAGAAATVAEASAMGLTIDSLHPCDLTKPEQVKAYVDFAVSLHGGIDILVNAAAFGVFEPLATMDFENGWRRTMSGELDVVFLACQAAWPHLVKRHGGVILNFASANAYVALETSPAIAHCAGKGGVLAMTRQIAAEGSPHGIRANTISPALVETAATKYPLENIPGFREQVMTKLMVKRLGQPVDIAWAAVYLCSDESSWVTGSDFQINGGATSW